MLARKLHVPIVILSRAFHQVLLGNPSLIIHGRPL